MRREGGGGRYFQGFPLFVPGRVWGARPRRAGPPRPGKRGGGGRGTRGRSRGGARGEGGGVRRSSLCWVRGRAPVVELVLRGEGDVLGVHVHLVDRPRGPPVHRHRARRDARAPGGEPEPRDGGRRGHARARAPPAPREAARREAARAAASAAARAPARAGSPGQRGSGPPRVRCRRPARADGAADASARGRGRWRASCVPSAWARCECEWRKTTGACARADPARVRCSARTPAPEPRGWRDGCHRDTAKTWRTLRLAFEAGRRIRGRAVCGFSDWNAGRSEKNVSEYCDWILNQRYTRDLEAREAHEPGSERAKV